MLSDYCRDPMHAALIAAAVTIAYVYIKSSMNNEKLPNSAYTKPAFLVGLLVYFIVQQGNSRHETITMKPY
jgi:uncharacterized membrane protein YphA (DoxX/SURF4 family)